MGPSSLNSSEEDRFGDGDVTDAEEMEEGVANDSMASTPMFSGSGNCPGADVELRGYGSASLMECLDRSLSGVPSLAPLLPAPLREQLSISDLSLTCDKVPRLHKKSCKKTLCNRYSMEYAPNNKHVCNHFGPQITRLYWVLLGEPVTHVVSRADS